MTPAEFAAARRDPRAPVELEFDDLARGSGGDANGDLLALTAIDRANVVIARWTFPHALAALETIRQVTRGCERVDVDTSGGGELLLAVVHRAYAEEGLGLSWRPRIVGFRRVRAR